VEHGSIVESASGPGPSGVRGKRVARHHSLLALPNSVGYRAFEPIPYRLTRRGRAEVDLYRRELAQRAIHCQHVMLVYDSEDQVYACDQCGGVWTVEWSDGRAYLGDRL
jgi:hypothetical protein